MQVTFWGVRGSIPTPGLETHRWGGNSSCIEVRHPGHPPLVLDCGTGARKLGFKLVAEPGRELDLLFTHFHMDHLFGFPFFVPIYTPGYQIRVWSPGYAVEEAREKLGRYLNGVYHPTRLRELPAHVSFHPLRPGRPFEVAGYQVQGLQLNHPGGSVGYRIEAGGQSVCYMTDTAPFAPPGSGAIVGGPPVQAEQRVIDFMSGTDLVIYDTMYEVNEYLEKMTWGHSYPDYAHALCVAAGVRRLVLFHHLPSATDDALDALAERWATSEDPIVSVAREGESMNAEG